MTLAASVEALLRSVRDTPPRPVAGYGRVSWAEIDIF
jgi:hypothetical protein